MAGQQLYPESFAPNIVLPGQVQAFTFSRPLSQWQLINRFTPTLITSCDNLFEFINLNEAGYRFHQSTSLSSQRGDFIFEQFINGHIPGIPLFKIQESTGNFIFSPQSGGAIQINNGTSVTPLQFYNSSGTHYAAIQAGNLTSNVTWTLPLTDSTGTQALISNGSGALSFSSFANNLAKYIIQTADSGLPNAQVLASLSTGIVKNTTTTGVLSIATPGTDYYSPGHPTTLIDDFNLNGDPFNSYGNTALGTLALNSLILNDSTNTYNVAIGSEALYQFTTGFGNTALGMSPLFSLVSGNNNTVIGAFSAGFMTSGDQNCIVGSYPTFGNVVSGSNRNTVMGYAAAQNQTIYNSCVFLGANADGSVNNLFNAIAIGDGALVGANNTCVIGQSGRAMNLIVNGIAGAGAGTINAIWNGTPVSLQYGGTGANLTPSAGAIPYSTSSVFALLAPTTSNKVFMSGTGTVPAWSTATYPVTTTINQILYSSAANTIGGISTANSATLVTNSSGVPSMTSSLTNGQVIIGSTGATPTPATLTQGTGITITNGAGSITIASNGTPQTIVDQNTSSVTMAVNTVYIINNGASLVTLTLNATAALGATFEIVGFSAGGWTIAQNTGQTIHFNSTNTTTGVSGSLSSTVQYNCVKLRCSKANTDFTVIESEGNLTVV